MGAILTSPSESVVFVMGNRRMILARQVLCACPAGLPASATKEARIIKSFIKLVAFAMSADVNSPCGQPVAATAIAPKMIVTTAARTTARRCSASILVPLLGE
jgi:hypothetical protein